MKLFDRTQFESSGSISGIFALAKKINLYDIKRRGDKTIFWCKLKDEQKCIAILTDMCYNFEIKSRKGILPFLRLTLTRWGIIVGILISIVAVAIYPNIVLDISVNDADYENAAISILNEAGIKQYSFAFNIDTKGIQKTLLSLDGISFAKVVREGTKVKVELKRELPKADYFPLSNEAIIATKQAVFSRAVLYGGTCLKKYGDIVKVGDVLIASYTLIDEQQVPCLAGGEVYGITYYEAELYYNYYDNIKFESYKNSVKLLAKSQIKGEAKVLSEKIEKIDFDGGVIIKVILEVEERIDI